MSEPGRADRAATDGGIPVAAADDSAQNQGQQAMHLTKHSNDSRADSVRGEDQEVPHSTAESEPGDGRLIRSADVNVQQDDNASRSSGSSTRPPHKRHKTVSGELQSS